MTDAEMENFMANLRNAAATPAGRRESGTPCMPLTQRQAPIVVVGIPVALWPLRPSRVIHHHSAGLVALRVRLSGGCLGAVERAGTYRARTGLAPNHAGLPRSSPRARQLVADPVEPRHWCVSTDVLTPPWRHGSYYSAVAAQLLSQRSYFNQLLRALRWGWQVGIWSHSRSQALFRSG